MERQALAKKMYNMMYKYENLRLPEIVRKYNYGMGGVDLLDQFIAYYRIKPTCAYFENKIRYIGFGYKSIKRRFRIAAEVRSWDAITSELDVVEPLHIHGVSFLVLNKAEPKSSSNISKMQ